MATVFRLLLRLLLLMLCFCPIPIRQERLPLHAHVHTANLFGSTQGIGPLLAVGYVYRSGNINRTAGGYNSYCPNNYIQGTKANTWRWWVLAVNRHPSGSCSLRVCFRRVATPGRRSVSHSPAENHVNLPIF
jgi:hypothetical protein